jgi:hypothetical protein
LKQQGKVIKFHDKDERDEMAIFIAENPGPWIVTFSPPSTMAAALRDEDVMHLCTMKATSYHDDGHTVIFGTDNNAMGMGFEKLKLNYEKRMKGEGCKAIAFVYANAAEPDLSKDGLDWLCWILTISTVKKCYK